MSVLNYLIGKTITDIDVSNDNSEITFTMSDGIKFVMIHDEDCRPRYSLIGEPQNKTFEIATIITLQRGDKIQNIESREVWTVNDNFGYGLIIFDCDGEIGCLTSLEGWEKYEKHN